MNTVFRWRRLDRESLREELRTNLWFVPLVVVIGAVGLFALTYALDRAAWHARGFEVSVLGVGPLVRARAESPSA